jgi:hypothetical protein
MITQNELDISLDAYRNHTRAARAEAIEKVASITLAPLAGGVAAVGALVDPALGAFVLAALGALGAFALGALGALDEAALGALEEAALGALEEAALGALGALGAAALGALGAAAFGALGAFRFLVEDASLFSAKATANRARISERTEKSFILM